MAQAIKLMTSFGSRFRYLAGGKPFRYGTAIVLVSSLVTGGVYAAPTVVAEVKQFFNLYTDEELQAAEQAAAERASAKSDLQTQLTAAEDLLADVKKSKPTAVSVTDQVKTLQTAVKHARTELDRDDATTRDFETAERTLSKRSDALNDAVTAEEKRVAAEQKKAAEKAAKEKAAEAKRKAAAAQKAAEEAAREQAAQQEQPPTDNGGGGTGGGGGEGTYNPPAPPPPPPPSTQRASSSLPLSCPTPTSVTFTASGGGSVTISAGGASNSGSGSASVTVTVSGSVVATATGDGSVSISSTAC